MEHVGAGADLEGGVAVAHALERGVARCGDGVAVACGTRISAVAPTGTLTRSMKSPSLRVQVELT
ncbi:MAG TPA: hypothetical protein VEO01_11165 [Pseudonocardiaceae bacterium]|nr:hypothetical protein [Pseudonocardiaceae bacterium]